MKSIKEKHRKLARIGFGLCIAAAALGTLEWVSGNLVLYVFNGVLLGVCAGLTIFNYHKAGDL